MYLLCLPSLENKFFEGKNAVLLTIDPHCLGQSEDTVNV